MQTFSLLFYPKTGKGGQTYIYGRVTIQGKRTEISTGQACDPEKWNTPAGKPHGNSEDAKSLTAYLDSLKRKIQDAFTQLQNSGEQVTIEQIKKKLNGKTERPITIVEVFEDHNKKIEELIGNSYAAATLQRYKTSLMHVVDFMQWKFKIADIDIKKIDHAFITEFEFYLRSVRKCANNSAVKYVKNFKKIVRICMANGWIDKDPFVKYKAKLKKIERVFLTKTELQKVIDKDFKTDRLRLVRDIFVFSCYTGLAYSDVKNLNSSSIVKGIDGSDWIVLNRQKTGTKSRIPLLPAAAEILAKYKDHPQCNNEDKLLPILSNQKMNSYLKEIGDLCEILKELTFHVARHTFATTVALSNGISISTLKEMLGHSSVKMTEHYAKTTDERISEEMNGLKQRMSLQIVHSEQAAISA